MKHSAMNQSQYARPGQTCHNSVLNKLLFLDLSRQTLSPGIMTDFDAMAAFDRVWLGWPIHCNLPTYGISSHSRLIHVSSP
jgi:hypothetical protein